MEQDLRALFEKQKKDERFTLKQGHEERFLKKLRHSMPTKKKSTTIGLKIAASIVILLGIGLGVRYFNTRTPSDSTIVEVNDDIKTDFTFGDLSPDLKKVERYYETTINLELSQLEIAPETKELIDSFMEQLTNLNSEYKTLNLELKELGPNDQTITALIENLQYRLQLLQKLRRKLNELKPSKNEQIKENTM